MTIAPFAPGQMIRVADNAPYHAGRVGKFDFMAGPQKDCVVLIDHQSSEYKLVFAIAEEYAIPVKTTNVWPSPSDK